MVLLTSWLYDPDNSSTFLHQELGGSAYSTHGVVVRITNNIGEVSDVNEYVTNIFLLKCFMPSWILNPPKARGYLATSLEHLLAAW